jgi:hypothetical protein
MVVDGQDLSRCAFPDGSLRRGVTFGMTECMKAAMTVGIGTMDGVWGGVRRGQGARASVDETGRMRVASARMSARQGRVR